MNTTDVIIIGAGAAGLMCAIEAGKRNRSVIVIDHANKPGKKILMSGGGRCNFTNYNISFDNYFSNNHNFFKSALSRYTQWDFLSLVQKHKIPYHEKKHGQLFCDNKSKDILDMLLLECNKHKAKINLETKVLEIKQKDISCNKNTNDTLRFNLKTDKGNFECKSLVIASGGLSIPTMGASPFGYKVAEQFGIKILPTRAGLVPFTLHQKDKDKLADLSGISAECIVNTSKKSFFENILFTHRGISGPAILQLSSYWEPGEIVSINFFPKINILDKLKQAKIKQPNILLKNLLTEYLARKIVAAIIPVNFAEKSLQLLSHKELESIANLLQNWQIKPNGTEGYRTAEVTIGGVDCDAISSKTMEANNVPGLYFIGEVLDVTGWLGGFNFQWAWSSGWAAGQYV